MRTKHDLLPPTTTLRHQIFQYSTLFLSKRINRSVAPPHACKLKRNYDPFLSEHVVPRPASRLETCFARLCLESDENTTTVFNSKQMELGLGGETMAFTRTMASNTRKRTRVLPQFHFTYYFILLPYPFQTSKFPLFGIINSLFNHVSHVSHKITLNIRPYIAINSNKMYVS